MSYQPKKTGDTLNDYFSALTEFVSLSPKLLSAKTPDSFEIWLEKLELIDKRALYLFLKKHKNNIPVSHMKLAQRRFKKEI